MSVTNWYVDGSAGSDNNGGSSEGSAIVSGSSGSTNGTATVDLSGDTPDLSGVSVGDSIRINGESGGINSTDIFEITAVDDGLDTVNVTPTPGTASGLTWAIGGAFATIQRALNVVEPGDGTVWVKASATYNEALTTSTAGTAANPIVIEGYTSSTGDGGIATNDGTTGSLANGWTPISGTNHYVWKNFCFTNFTATAFGSTSGDYVKLYRVRGSSSSTGIAIDQHGIMLACCGDGNSGDGLWIGDFGSFVNCIAYNNAVNGMEATAGIVVVGCLLYNNTGDAVSWTGSNAYGVFDGNTIVAASASANTGLSINPASNTNKIICINNTVSGYSGSGGIGIEGPSVGDAGLVFNNNVYDCETNYSGLSDLGGGTTSDPSFVNAGSNDYTPSGASPLIAAGMDASDAPGAPTLTAAAATVGALLRATVTEGTGRAGILTGGRM